MESPFDISSNKTFTLYIETILEPLSEEYKEVLGLDIMPEGPLNKCVFQTRLPELSPFKYPYNITCSYYLTKFPSTKTYMYRTDIPSVFSFLQSNGYTINTSLTRLYRHNNIKTRELVCVINYNN
jgi:hypothetical protein